MSETAAGHVPASAAHLPPRPASRRLAQLLGAPLRHPGRFFAILLLLALTAAGAAAAGVYLWAGHHLRAARGCLSSRQDLAARDHLEKCLTVWPRDAETLLLAARTARRLGGLDEAGHFLNRYEEVRGADDDLILERILLRIERGDCDGASTYWRQRIEEGHPEAPVLLESLVRGFIRSYRLRDADGALERWRKIEPASVQIEFLSGALQDIRDRLPEALDHYREALDLDPERDDIRERLADIQLRLDLAQEALPHLKHIAQRRPNSAAAQVRLARCYLLLGRKEDARALLESTLERWPEVPAALAERGELALAEDDLEDAENWLRRSLALAPQQFQVRYQLQRCLSRQRKDDEARAEQTKLDELKKDSHRAREILVGEMQRRPRDPELHSEAGRLALRLGQTEDGLHWLQSALKLNPHHKATHEALAEHYRRMGNQGLASRHKELAGAGSPSGPPR